MGILDRLHDCEDEIVTAGRRSHLHADGQPVEESDGDVRSGQAQVVVERGVRRVSHEEVVTRYQATLGPCLRSEERRAAKQSATTWSHRCPTPHSTQPPLHPPPPPPP